MRSVANLRLLHDRVPEAELLNTWNAADNAHMVRINGELGFRPVERWQNWQLDLRHRPNLPPSAEPAAAGHA